MYGSGTVSGALHTRRQNMPDMKNQNRPKHADEGALEGVPQITLPDGTTVEATLIPHDLQAVHRTVTFAYRRGDLYVDVAIMRFPGETDSWFASGHVSIHEDGDETYLAGLQVHAEDCRDGEPVIPVPLVDDDEIAIAIAAWWLRQHPGALAASLPSKRSPRDQSASE